MMELATSDADPGGGTRAARSRAAAPLSILHVVAPAPVGGLESVLRLMTAGQLANGHRVHVAATIDPGVGEHVFLDALETSGVDVTRIVVGGRAYLEERRRFAALFSRLRPDLVHTHGYRPDLLAGGIARALSIPTVTTVHGSTGGTVLNHVYECLQRASFHRFDAVVAVSDALRDRLHRRWRIAVSRLHVVRNAYDASVPRLARAAAREALGAAGDAFTIGWVGRMSVEKAPDVFVDAMLELSRDDVRAVLIGDGPERAQLEALARARGIADRLHWRGTMSAVAPLYPGFDAFVLSSRTEGIPMVLLEAVAAGTPIVATRVGGVPEVVGDDEALLVPSEDPAAIAQAVRMVRDDPAAAARRAAKARARLDREFGIEPWLARYDRIYRSVLSRFH